jgi:integrase/recombinase XerD
MQRLQQLFDQFLRERVYVNNITPATREWYECAWKAFGTTLRDRPESSAGVTRADLQHFVITLRERGVKPVSCNTWLRALNAFCRWLHEQGDTPALVKLAPQRLEKRIIRTHDDAAIRALVTYRPTTFAHRRVHALALTILDTGCRIEEPLTATVRAFDFDNLLLTIYGKGRKERRVPMSVELRRQLFRFGQARNAQASNRI